MQISLRRLSPRLPSASFELSSACPSELTCAAGTSLIVVTLRTQPTSTLVRYLVGTDQPVGVSRLVGVLSTRTSSILGSAAKRRHRANAPTTEHGVVRHRVVSQRVWCSHPLCACFGFSSLVLVWFFSCFGRRYASWGSVGFPSVLCQEAQFRFRWRHPTSVRDAIFLLKFFFTHDSRYAPWLAHTGCEYHTALWRPTSCCVTVRLRTPSAPGL